MSKLLQLKDKDGLVYVKTLPILASVYYADVTDITWSNQIIPFNNIEWNIGNAYNISTRMFTAPVAGIYQANFTCYTNLNTDVTSADRRYHILQRLANGTEVLRDQVKHPSSGGICGSYFLNKGDTLSLWAGNNFGFYGAKNHNRFTITLISQV